MVLILFDKAREVTTKLFCLKRQITLFKASSLVFWLSFDSFTADKQTAYERPI
jgi:hypothetical protein